MRLTTAAVVLAFCSVSFAQYSGGTGTGMSTPGSPGYTPPSGGYKANGALIGGLVGGGAAAGVGIYYMVHHRNLYTGCVSDDGKSLVQKNGTRFQLQGTSLKPGEKISLRAKKSASEGGDAVLDVQDVRKDFGACEQLAQK